MPASKKIPLADLSAQHRNLKKEIQAAIWRVINNSSFIQGPEVRSFEKEFAAYCGVGHAAGCASGTAALELVLHAWGIGPGDEVITTPFTFIATAEAVVRVGAKPVFVDVEQTGGTLDVSKLEAAVTAHTRAVIAVHLYGQCADMDPILAVARRYSIKVIEDAAQAHGARYRGRRAGSLADAAVFSFYPGKNLGAMGDAGIVTTQDASLAARIRRLADHGRQDKYLHQEAGFNYRLDAIQAAILRAKLPYLDRWNERRRKIASLYTRMLSKTPVKTPQVLAGREPIWHQYVIRTPQRDALRDALERAGISVGIHYPVPLHLQPAFEALGLRAGAFPVSERWAQEALSLPMYPELTDAQIKRVAAAVHNFFKPVSRSPDSSEKLKRKKELIQESP